MNSLLLIAALSFLIGVLVGIVLDDAYDLYRRSKEGR